MNDLRYLLPAGLVVSVHVDEMDSFDRLELVRLFALSAEKGGAVGLRIQGVDTVAALRPHTRLPIVGFVKGAYADGAVLVTPAMDDIEALFNAGADIVAVDATKRRRPSGMDAFVFFEDARRRFKQPLWADCASFREGIRAAESGADAVATTLAGYSGNSAGVDYHTPDFELINELSSALLIPVMAEGRIWTPDDAARALLAGAYCAVVGSAITRPRLITESFVEAMRLVGYE